MPLFRKFSLALIWCIFFLGQVVDAHQLVDDYEWEIQRGFHQHDNLLEKTRQIIEMAKVIALSHGVELEIKMLQSDKGPLREYPVLKVVASQASLANKEAYIVQQQYGGLELYLSPYDLKRSRSDAFFNPDGSFIGVPYDFIYNRVVQESYLHEKMHATTYLQLIHGQQDRYAGVFKLLHGQQMSANNYEGYIRHSSLDEIKTTLFSAQFSLRELYNKYQNSSPEIFFNDRENEKLLDEIRFRLTLAQGLAKQLKDLSSQALKRMIEQRFEIQEETIGLGTQLKRKVFSFVFLVDSYSREVVPGGGRTELVARSDGTQLKFYALNNDREKLSARLQDLGSEANSDLLRVELALSKIAMRIEFADLKRTDLKALYHSLLAD